MDSFHTHTHTPSASLASVFCFARVTFLFCFHFLSHGFCPRGRRCHERKPLAVLSAHMSRWVWKEKKSGRKKCLNWFFCAVSIITDFLWSRVVGCTFVWAVKGSLTWLFSTIHRFIWLTSTHNHFGAKQVDMMLLSCARLIHTTDIWWFSDTQPADVM